ncbi:MAG: cytochrome c [Acidobacteria bacterium]|nr:cytochrome c [Acidobacteriota bacterium]MBI3279197.1 cytochrome c [Acidobacteriota bacterium]
MRVLAIFAFLGAAFAATADQDYEVNMKAAKSALDGISKALQAQAGSELAAGAEKMSDIYQKNFAFWTERKQGDAVKLSNDGIAALQALNGAAKASNWTEAGASFKKLRGTCAGCHDIHREKLPDGSYRIKQQ